MRLELLCEMSLAYNRIDSKQDFVLVRPYDSEEGSGFGTGVGTVTGDRLSGTIRWVNHPHRRTDKTMLPNLHGVITTADGASVLVTMEGRTIFPTPFGNQLLTTILEAEDERYRWLNTIFCVLEGVIDVETGQIKTRVYVCINEFPGTDV